MTQKTKWLDLLINGDARKAEAAKVNDLYIVMIPAANLVDASGSGQNTPTVQGHRAVFDRNGVLLGVDALGWNAEGGFYNTKWPSKADSIYNANAAKTYAPQVFQQMKKDGGWLTKFKNGGSTQPTQDLAMKELMAIVQQAATELQSNKPGQGVQTLAQIANDPQGSQLLDVLVQQIPEAGQIVEAVMKMVGAFKCGGKAKKKVKKGAKGCVPCKKLMRVGGKLVNVLTDCEGNIISKHQAGGYLIPKGQLGLDTDGIVTNDQFKSAKTTYNQGDPTVHYYVGNDGKIVYLVWDTATNQWITKVFDLPNFNEWNKNNKMLADGAVYDPTTGKVTFTTEAQARAALGSAYDDAKYNIAGETIRGVIGKSGHMALGTSGAVPTYADAIEQKGYRRASFDNNILERARLAEAKDNFRAARRDVYKDPSLWGQNYLKNSRKTYKAHKDVIRTEHANERRGLILEYINTEPAPVAATGPAQPANSSKSTITEFKPYAAKHGGWLNKQIPKGYVDIAGDKQ